MICMVSVNFCLPFFLAEFENIVSTKLIKSCKIFHKLQQIFETPMALSTISLKTPLALSFKATLAF